MSLIHSFESSGNVLFKYRGQIPILLFIIAVPFMYFTDFSVFGDTCYLVLTVSSVVISILGFIVRFIAIGSTPAGTSGRNTDKQVAEQLNQTGIYSVIRHPLYLGNYLIWAGMVLFTFNFYFLIIMSLAFWLYYERIMFAEERFLFKQFGESYDDWSLKVPAFIPAFSKYVRSSIPFSLKTVLRREYSGVGATALGYAFIDLLRVYLIDGTFEYKRVSVCAFIVALLLVLVLRTIKHNTKILEEKGRS